LIGRAPRKKDFEYVIDQVNAKLMHWKANQLSFAGRVTLAKSVLEAIPIYPMMTNIIPKSCIDEIHRIQRRFIWGDTNQSRKYHAVGWDVVTRPKANGGLGLRKLDVMNKACILKLGRKIQSGALDFWCAVLKGKYNRGMDEGVVLARANDSHLWKSIVRLWPQLDTHSWWTIGDGKQIDLCHDAWIEEGFRLEDYITQIPDNLRTVKLVHIVNDGDWDWNMLNSWVPLNIQEKIGALLPPSDNNGSDKQICKESAGGIFSIAGMYHALCGYDLNNNDKAWKHRMGLGSDMCDFCRDHKDTTLHALRDCMLVRPLWLSVVDASLRYEFFTSNLDKWIEMNVRTNGGKINYEDWSNY
jgi:hypothetical protein